LFQDPYEIKRYQIDEEDDDIVIQSEKSKDYIDKSGIKQEESKIRA